MTIQSNSPFSVGSVTKHGEEFVYVERTWKRYYSDDGRSFGLDAESGTVFYAEVRPATAEESSQDRNYEAVWQEFKDAEKAARPLFHWENHWGAGERTGFRKLLDFGDWFVDSDDDFVYRDYNGSTFRFTHTPARDEAVRVVVQLRAMKTTLRQMREDAV